MTFYEIYQDILDELNISATDYERQTSNIVVDAINEAQKELLKFIEYSKYKDYLLAEMSKEQALTFTGNIAPAPSDLEIPLALWRVDSNGNYHNSTATTKAYVYSVQDNAFEKPSLYNPMHVFEDGDVLVYPVPATGETITLYYIKQPTEWSGTSDTSASPDYPEVVHPAIKYMACHILVKQVESGFEEKTNEYFAKALEHFGVSNVKQG